VNGYDPNEETIASLLHTIALIREASGLEGVMLGDLPREIAALKAERDEARRSACIFKARYMDTRIGFSPMTEDEANAEARRIAARMRWDCFDAKEGKP
jgi:hypothetical protein